MRRVLKPLTSCRPTNFEGLAACLLLWEDITIIHFHARHHSVLHEYVYSLRSGKPRSEALQLKHTNMDAEEEDWLPVPPEEPLPSDCCGSGCTPCVQDIYQEELARWRRLKEMSVEERRIFFEKEKRKVDDRRGEVPSAISPGQYTYFDVESIRKAAGSANVYRFKLPPAHNLGLSLGQHIIARWVALCH